MAVEAQPGRRQGAQLAAGAVDCDIHPLVKGGLHGLFPYLPDAWIRRFENREMSDHPLISVRYPHPASVLRIESTPPDGGAPGSDAGFVITDHLDRYELYRGLLLPIQAAMVAAWSDALEAAALVSAYNRYFIENWLARDERFRMAMVVAPQSPEAAAKEIRAIGSHRAIVAVWLPLINVLLGSRYFNPVYDAATELGLPILVHATGAEGTFQGAPMFAGGVPSTFTERYTMTIQPAESNVVSLVFEGTFDRYPTLKVAFVENGWSWLPGWMWRMDGAWRSLRIDVPWVKRPPSEYVADHIRFSTEPLDEPPRPEMLEQMLDMAMADRTLMFSSDYPHWDSDDPNLVLRRIPDRLRSRVARETALETFPKLA